MIVKETTLPSESDLSSTGSKTGGLVVLKDRDHSICLRWTQNLGHSYTRLYRVIWSTISIARSSWLWSYSSVVRELL